MSRSAINSAASLVAYTVSLGVGLAYTPFLVRSLGPAAYGLIPLTFSIVQYMGFLVQTVSSTTGQRLIASINDQSRYNIVFSTSLVACGGLAGFALLAGGLLAVISPSVLQIPEGLGTETRWLIAAGVASFALSLLLNPIDATLFSQQALFVNSLVQALQTIVRVMTVVALFLIIGPSLNFVSVGLVVAPIIGATVLIPVARRLRPSLRFSPSVVRPKLIREMIRTAGGVFIGQFGTMLLASTELLFMNLIYGPARGGAYAATMQWAVVLRGLGLSLAANANARVMQAYHESKQGQLIAVTTRYMRLLCVFLALPAGYIAGVAPDLLSIWLGPDFTENAPILVALSLPAAINLASIPLGAIMLAADRTYHSGWCYMLTAIIFVVLAPLAAQALGWGGLEIALVLGFVLLTKNWIFMVPFAARLAGPGALRPFLLASLQPILWVIASFAVVKMLAILLHPQTFLGLAVVGILSVAPYCLIVFFSLPKGDITLLQKMSAKLVAPIRRWAKVHLWQ